MFFGSEFEDARQWPYPRAAAARTGRGVVCAGGQSVRPSSRRCLQPLQSPRRAAAEGRGARGGLKWRIRGLGAITGGRRRKEAPGFTCHFRPHPISANDAPIHLVPASEKPERRPDSSLVLRPASDPKYLRNLFSLSTWTPLIKAPLIFSGDRLLLIELVRIHFPHTTQAAFL